MVTLNPMNMDTISIRDLLNQDMVITMDMDTLMFTRTVIIIMDLMVMRLIMIIRRDLLRLDMAMVVIATSMSTGLTLITRLRFIIHKHITMDMARDLLSLDMDTLMFTRTVIIIMDLMDMRLIMIIRRDLLRL